MRIYHGSGSLSSSYVATGDLFVTWPGGFTPSYVQYSSPWKPAFVGNALAMAVRVYGVYGSPPGSVTDITNNLSGLVTAVRTYAVSYGSTYAAVRHRNANPNVRSVEWV